MNEIERIIKEMHVSQNCLGQNVGVCQQHIGRYIKGTRTPSVETAKRIILYARKNGVNTSLDAIYGI
jgi:predicted transcriptional regulator